MLTVLSILCYVFAALDLALFYIFDIDITGFAYSPVVACGLGWLFSALGNKNKSEE